MPSIKRTVEGKQKGMAEGRLLLEYRSTPVMNPMGGITIRVYDQPEANLCWMTGKGECRMTLTEDELLQIRMLAKGLGLPSGRTVMDIRSQTAVMDGYTDSLELHGDDGIKSIRAFNLEALCEEQLPIDGALAATSEKEWTAAVTDIETQHRLLLYYRILRSILAKHQA